MLQKNYIIHLSITPDCRQLMIILYANAGQGVGFGHVFRLFPILDGLQKNRIPARMIVPLPETILNKLGVTCAESIEPGIESISSLLAKENPEVFFFDSYEHPNRLIENVSSKKCIVICFDDHYRIEKSVHTIVNPALDADPKKYKDVSQFTFLGPNYFPLLDGFQDVRQQLDIRSKVRKIMVSMGGDDTEGSLDRILKALFNEITSNIIVDVYGNNMPSVIHPMLNKPGWLPQTELIQKLGEYDIAVLAGGSMLQQCACIGLPVISLPQNFHQAHHAGSWEKTGSVMLVKNTSELKPVFKKILNWEVRKRMSRSGYRTVDGIGAIRLVKHLKKIVKELVSV